MAISQVSAFFSRIGERSVQQLFSSIAHNTGRRSKHRPTATDSTLLHVRTLFISDVHLGTRGCKAELLTEFLQRHEATTIFLVGDIMENRCLKRGRLRWLQHENVAAELLAKARNGTRVIYIPGNHDYLLRGFAGSSFEGIEIALTAIHESAGGQRYLVTHGDQFDIVLRHLPWLAHIGDWAYHMLLALNSGLNAVSRAFGLRYWSLSAWAKRKVKGVVNYISRFEASLSSEARRQGAQGVVCGHIHHAADRDVSGIHYLNSGDWVESCTGIVEHNDGRFEIVRWANAERLRCFGFRVRPAVADGIHSQPVNTRASGRI